MCNIPLVSIVVLTYNQEDTVGKTLDSILAQKVDFAYEVIIGEDASPSDNTRGVCESYAAQYPDIIRLMPKAANKGLMRNYWDCVKSCRGKYIAVCAGDDWWHNDDKLQMQVDYLESNSQCVLVYTNYDIFKPAYNSITRSALPKESLDTTGMTDKLMHGFFLPSLTIMYRNSALEFIDFEQYIERGYMAEDLPMYLDWSLHGDFGCIDVSTATYRAEAGSLSHFSDANKMECFLLSVKRIKLDFLAAHPSISTLNADKIEQTYSMYIFRNSFSRLDLNLVNEYAAKLTQWSLANKVRLFISRSSLLWWFYTKTIKIILQR